MNGKMSWLIEMVEYNKYTIKELLRAIFPQV